MGHLYQPRKFPRVRILLYGHYRVLYLPEKNGDIRLAELHWYAAHGIAFPPS